MKAHSFDSATALVANALGCDPGLIAADAAIGKHPNWDSISHLNVMMILEQEFGIEINDVSITEFTTLVAIEKLFAEPTN